MINFFSPASHPPEHYVSLECSEELIELCGNNLGAFRREVVYLVTAGCASSCDPSTALRVLSSLCLELNLRWMVAWLLAVSVTIKLIQKRTQIRLDLPPGLSMEQNGVSTQQLQIIHPALFPYKSDQILSSKQTKRAMTCYVCIVHRSTSVHYIFCHQCNCRFMIRIVFFTEVADVPLGGTELMDRWVYYFSKFFDPSPRKIFLFHFICLKQRLSFSRTDFREHQIYTPRDCWLFFARLKSNFGLNSSSDRTTTFREDYYLTGAELTWGILALFRLPDAVC